MTLNLLVYLPLLVLQLLSVRGECPQGSVVGVHPDDCYVLTLAAMAWSEAESNCTNQYGGNLISIENANVNGFLKSISPLLAVSFWSGGNNIDGGKWLWSDGTLFKYTNWEIGYPINESMFCVVIETNTGKWTTHSCIEDVRPFICKVPATLQELPTSAPCPGGLSTPAPQPTCPPAAPVASCPPAVTCPSCPPPLPVPTCPYCAPQQPCPPVPTCPEQLAPPTCPPPPPPPSPSCPPNFSSCPGSNYCYAVVNGAVKSVQYTAADADYQCQALGSTLATIDSNSVTQCLMDLASSSSLYDDNWQRVWIGLFDLSQNPAHTSSSEWTWLDGTTYSNNNLYNWAQEEPNNANGVEWCVSMFTENVYDESNGITYKAGNWNDDNCNTIFLPAFCSAPVLYN
jgi:hypothetical protein